MQLLFCWLGRRGPGMRRWPTQTQSPFRTRRRRSSPRGKRATKAQCGNSRTSAPKDRAGTRFCVARHPTACKTRERNLTLVPHCSVRHASGSLTEPTQGLIPGGRDRIFVRVPSPQLLCGGRRSVTLSVLTRTLAQAGTRRLNQLVPPLLHGAQSRAIGVYPVA